MFNRHAHSQRKDAPGRVNAKNTSAKEKRDGVFRFPVNTGGFNTKLFLYSILCGAACAFFAFLGLSGIKSSAGDGLIGFMFLLALVLGFACFLCLLFSFFLKVRDYTVHVTDEKIILNGVSYPRNDIGMPYLKKIRTDTDKPELTANEIIFPLADDWVSTGPLMGGDADDQTRLLLKIQHRMQQPASEKASQTGEDGTRPASGHSSQAQGSTFEDSPPRSETPRRPPPRPGRL